MPTDLIIYALVAAGLVFWLRSVLGTRHGEERERPDPFSAAPAEVTQPLDTPAPEEEFEGPMTPQDAIKALAKEPTDTLGVIGEPAEAGLLAISEADKEFEIGFFFNAAQDVFAMAVEAFGEGDKELLGDLLGEDVFNAFEGAIDARAAAGETLMNEIHAIRKAEVIGAVLEDKRAQITVRFIADETSVLKDKEGAVLSGDPDRTTEMRDVWTFSRNLKSRDPRWLVIETRGDFDGDNETIPNTHE